MFLPIGTDRPLRRPTLVNHLLIAACVVVFLIQVTTQPETGTSRWMIETTLDPRHFRWWNLLSYQFLHGGPMHLLGNMLFLWVFGPNIEDRLGRLAYLGFFLMGGAAAGGLHALFESSPVIGASGSIAAVTGAYIVFFPRTHIRVLLFFFLIGVYSIPSLWFIGFAIARDLFFQGVESTGGGASGVAHLAHLGGYAFGIGVASALLALRVVPREPYDLVSLMKQAKRRRDFRAVAATGRSPWEHEGNRVRRAGREPADRAREELSRRRAALAEAVRTKDRRSAIERYLALSAEAPVASLGDGPQLELARWLFEDGHYPEADAAFAAFLDQNKSGPEADRVRLMRALIGARYAHDPAGAMAHLDKINPQRLTPDETALFEALRAEVTP